jgi:transcriptional regulator with XRE-family HTH domain
MLTEVLYIGDRLREIRKRSLMTQEQLAERSGRRLAEALEVEPEELVRRADRA